MSVLPDDSRGILVTDLIGDEDGPYVPAEMLTKDIPLPDDYLYPAPSISLEDDREATGIRIWDPDHLPLPDFSSIGQTAEETAGVFRRLGAAMRRAMEMLPFVHARVEPEEHWITSTVTAGLLPSEDLSRPTIVTVLDGDTPVLTAELVGVHPVPGGWDAQDQVWVDTSVHVTGVEVRDNEGTLIYEDHAIGPIWTERGDFRVAWQAEGFPDRRMFPEQPPATESFEGYGGGSTYEEWRSSYLPWSYEPPDTVDAVLTDELRAWQADPEVRRIADRLAQPIYDAEDLVYPEVYVDELELSPEELQRMAEILTESNQNVPENLAELLGFTEPEPEIIRSAAESEAAYQQRRSLEQGD